MKQTFVIYYSVKCFYINSVRRKFMPATVYSLIVSFQKKLLNLMYRRIDKFRKPVILLRETFINNDNYIYFLRNFMLQIQNRGLSLQERLLRNGYIFFQVMC